MFNDNPAFSGQEKSAPQYPDASNFATKFEGYSQEGLVGYTGMLVEYIHLNVRFRNYFKKK